MKPATRPPTSVNHEPPLESYGHEPLLTMWLSFPYLEMVASSTFFGKSSAPTSPPTAIASPPNPLISSTTSCAFFSSRLQRLVCQWDLMTKKGVNVLADYDLCTLPGKDDSSTPSNSLRQTSMSIRAKEIFGGSVDKPEQHLGNMRPSVTRHRPLGNQVLTSDDSNFSNKQTPRVSVG